ncbi:hypothetical protein KDK95_33510, partial [Actinospica sp. MGRD01-02]|nr:hypothetical protein [Actinospica acidithermotolerans]
GQGWGSPQGQIPQQPNYPGAPGYGQPQDSVPGQPQGYGPQYGQPGYLPQTDFGSGGYIGYPGGVPQESALAKWSMWLGIFGGWGLINLVVSILAINETGPGKKLGRNKAVVGLCLTFAWAVLWIGLTLAFTSHAKSEIANDTVPTAVATAAATGGVNAAATTGSNATGAAGQAAGASGDAGCQAAQTAFDTYDSTISANSSNAITAMETLGNTLVSAGSQSQVAGSQLTTVGGDYLSLASGTSPSSLASDIEALDTACGVAFS